MQSGRVDKKENIIIFENSLADEMAQFASDLFYLSPQWEEKNKKLLGYFQEAPSLLFQKEFLKEGSGKLSPFQFIMKSNYLSMPKVFNTILPIVERFINESELNSKQARSQFDELYPKGVTVYYQEYKMEVENIIKQFEIMMDQMIEKIKSNASVVSFSEEIKKHTNNIYHEKREVLYFIRELAVTKKHALKVNILEKYISTDCFDMACGRCKYCKQSNGKWTNEDEKKLSPLQQKADAQCELFERYCINLLTTLISNRSFSESFYSERIEILWQLINKKIWMLDIFYDQLTQELKYNNLVHSIAKSCIENIDKDSVFINFMVGNYREKFTNRLDYIVSFGLYPENVQAYFFLADSERFYDFKKNYEEGVQLLKDAILKSPNDKKAIEAIDILQCRFFLQSNCLPSETENRLNIIENNINKYKSDVVNGAEKGFFYAMLAKFTYLTTKRKEQSFSLKGKIIQLYMNALEKNKDYDGDFLGLKFHCNMGYGFTRQSVEKSFSELLSETRSNGYIDIKVYEKNDIFNAVLTRPLKEQIALLTACKEKNTILGAKMWTQEGLTSCSMESGTLAKIEKQLILLAALQEISNSSCHEKSIGNEKLFEGEKGETILQAINNFPEEERVCLLEQCLDITTVLGKRMAKSSSIPFFQKPNSDRIKNIQDTLNELRGLENLSNEEKDRQENNLFEL